MAHPRADARPPYADAGYAPIVPPFRVGQRLRMRARTRDADGRLVPTAYLRGRAGRDGVVTKVASHPWAREFCRVGPCVQVRLDGARRPTWYWCGFFLGARPGR